MKEATKLKGTTKLEVSAVELCFHQLKKSEGKHVHVHSCWLLTENPQLFVEVVQKDNDTGTYYVSKH